MTRVGLIQTKSYSSNSKGIQTVSELLKKLGKKETEIVCLPEQWLSNNQINMLNDILNTELEYFSYN